MKTVLLLGLGRSTHTLIKYLVAHATDLNIRIILGDKTINNFIKSYTEYPFCDFIVFDVDNALLRESYISKADLVISMLPPRFHILVAKECIRFRKNLITASYASDEMRNLDKSAKDAGILILNEVGLDPGIDHISAMDIIDSLKRKGALIDSFKSFCGGLIAPESDNNPWNYKITWNPKNIILAGKSGASYLKNGVVTSFNYEDVFSNLEKVVIPNYGDFESYANRDSLHYKEKYNLHNTTTIVRGTLRHVGFSKAWNVFVQLGMTSDNNEKMINKEEFIKYVQSLNDQDVIEKMNYLDLFNAKYSNIDYTSPFDYLMNVLKDKWLLNESDKDMIVMQHKFQYCLYNERKELKLSMVVKGDDSVQTAMAKTVGLPVFFACKLLLKDKIKLRGVRIPVYPEIYAPILKELSNEGINFIQS